MNRDSDKWDWYNSLPKYQQEILDFWEDKGLDWIGPVWKDEPQSVELNGHTDAGEDMYIDLKEVSTDALKEYVENFDINENVAMWWENGCRGKGVPFNDQAEHVEDYESWLAFLLDIIDETCDVHRQFTHQQSRVIDKFNAQLKELELMNIAFDYEPDKGFTFRNSA